MVLLTGRQSSTILVPRELRLRLCFRTLRIHSRVEALALSSQKSGQNRFFRDRAITYGRSHNVVPYFFLAVYTTYRPTSVPHTLLFYSTGVSPEGQLVSTRMHPIYQAVVRGICIIPIPLEFWHPRDSLVRAGFPALLDASLRVSSSLYSDHHVHA